MFLQHTAEQDRAPHVPSHSADVARPTADGQIGRRRIDWATTTKTGLKVECALDERTYEKGIKISDAEMATLDIKGEAFHPEWNYTIRPRSAPAA